MLDIFDDIKAQLGVQSVGLPDFADIPYAKLVSVPEGHIPNLVLEDKPSATNEGNAVAEWTGPLQRGMISGGIEKLAERDLQISSTRQLRCLYDLKLNAELLYTVYSTRERCYQVGCRCR